MSLFIEIASVTSKQDSNKNSFNTSVTHLTNYLTDFFKKVKIPGCKALKMRIVDEESVQEHVLPSGSFSPIFFFFYKYDYNTNYLSKDNLAKKLEVVKLIKILAEAASSFMNIDYEVFSDAIVSIENLKGDFKENVNKPKKSPDKKFEALIVRSNEPDGASYNLIVRDLKDKSERSLHLFRSNLDGGVMAGYGPGSLADDGEWKSNELYEVFGRTKDIAFLCNVVEMTSEVEFKPSKQEDLEWVRSKFEINTTTDEERKLQLAKKFSK